MSIPTELDQLEDLLKKFKNLQVDGHPDEIPLQTSLPEIITHLRLCEQIIKDPQHINDTALLEHVWKLVTEASELSANSARIESVRTPLGVSGAIELSVSFLEVALPAPTLHLAAELQCMRSLGNLCFDHIENRKRVLDAGGVRVILDYIKVSTGSSSVKFTAYEILRTACGALMNASLKYEPAQHAIVETGGIPILAALLDPQRLRDGSEPAERIATLTARVMSGLVTLDDGRDIFANLNTITWVIELIKYIALEGHSKNIDLLEELVEIVDVSTEHQDIQYTIAKDPTNLYFVLLDFLENAQPPTTISESENEDGESEENGFQYLKNRMAHAIVSVTLNDKNMNPLYDNTELMTRLLRWLRDNDRDDLQMTAALCIGNLARSDAHTLDLVQNHHIEQLLVPLLEQNENALVQNAVVGLLKNLSLPKDNKSIIGATSIITRATILLDSKNDMLKPVQNGAIGILKHLSSGNLENATRIILPNSSTTPTPLDAVLALGLRTDDQTAKLESARVLVNLIKTIWAADVAETSSLRHALISRTQVTSALVTLIHAGVKWPILVNDGVLCLVVLVASDDDDGKVLNVLQDIEENKEEAKEENKEEEMEENENNSQKGVLEVLAGVIMAEGEKYADEIKRNVCNLLKKIAEKSKDRNPALYALLQTKMKSSLQKVSTDSNISKVLRDDAKSVLDIL